MVGGSLTKGEIISFRRPSKLSMLLFPQIITLNASMLIYFSAENYRSIDNRIELNLRSNNRLRHHRDHVRFPVDGEPRTGVLKLAALYGANAAGKSNIIRAIEDAIEIITGTYKPKKNLNHQPFILCNNRREQPTEFYFEFCLLNRRYSYSFSFDEKRIIEEELCLFSNDESYKTIFLRQLNEDKMEIHSDLLPDENDLSNESLLKALNDANNEKKLDNKLFEEIKHSIEIHSALKRTPKDKLIISEISTRNFDDISSPVVDFIAAVKNYFSFKVHCISPDSRFKGIHNEIDKEEESRFVSCLREFDTGIYNFKKQPFPTDSIDNADIEVIKKQIKNSVNDSTTVLVSGEHVKFFLEEETNELKAETLNSIHIAKDGSEISFNIQDESDGSIRLMDLIPVMTANPSPNMVATTFIIDEFNRSLHPKIAVGFIKRFIDYSAKNDNQLIVSTHESEILNSETLRRDEIFFVQKEKDGSTHLYPLDEYSTRYDRDIRKAYLSGKFGAIPKV